MTDPLTFLKETLPVTANNWGLLGHNWAVEMLRQHLIQNTTRQAYLITGPAGAGKRTLALRFAQATICQQPLKPGIPCRTCRECKQIEAMQHPDLAIIQAETPGGTLKVDQVRAVRRTLSLKPYQAKYRIALFLRFQEASEGAANALLKMLEEAPQYVILLLTADAPEQLLPTITSRCEILRLRPLPMPALNNFLKSRGAQAEQAELIAHIAGGCPGYAIRLLEDKSALEFRAERLDELQTLLSASRVDKFKYAETMAKDKNILRQTLLVWLSYWRDILLQVSGAATPIANIDRVDSIMPQAEGLDLGKASRVVHKIETALKQLERNVNARLLMEVILIDLPKP